MGAIVAAYARLCADRCVAEVCIGPGLSGAVAGVARLACDNVTEAFASRLDTVMAARAASRDFIVVHPDDRLEDRRRVARFALIRRQRMR